MGKNYIEKEHTKYNHGLIENPSAKLKRKWDRHNKEIGHFRNEKNKLKDKIYGKLFERHEG